MQPLDEVNYLLEYIDCARSHPRPLPEDTHTYHSTIAGLPWLHDIYHCLYKLYRENMASEMFREPVNALQYNIFQYYKVITQPMSIREVLDRLASGTHYLSLDQVEADIELIWKNAELFNGPGSEITVNAQNCRKILAQLREEWENEKIPPPGEAEALVEEIVNMQNEALNQELENLFTGEFSGLLSKDMELDCEKVRIRHIKVLKALRDRYS